MRSRLAIACLIALCACNSREKALAPGQFADIQIDTALQSALAKASPYQVIKAEQEIPDTSCTYFVPSKGITDQGPAGLCWYYSTTNILRQRVIARDGRDEFYFSHAFGQFYDLLEKSNFFLENVIENRRKPIDNEENKALFARPVWDGGTFTNASHLIDKYGLVPLEAMPDNYSTTTNADMMQLLRTLLRRWGTELRRTPKSQLNEVKNQALNEVYKVLCYNIGTPPSEFEFEGQTYTPLSFRDAFVDVNTERDYAILMNDPAHKYYRRYEVEDSRNCWEYANWTYLNLPMEDLEKLGIQSLKRGERFYITADTNKDEFNNFYTLGVHPVDSALGISTQMDKQDLVESQEIKSAHAIAVAGVKLDAEGRPLKWVIENSFGPGRGEGGYVVMTAEWLRQYLFRFAVRRECLSEDQLSLLELRPHLL